jgi:hypothetical protein
MRYRISKAFAADVDGKEYKYKQSIAINEALGEFELLPPDGTQAASSHLEVAGTAYPTVQMRGDADNVVLLPQFVDRSLKIKSVNYVVVEDACGSTSEFRLLTIGFANTFAGDEIEWWNDIGNEHDRRSSVRFENGDWIVHDSNNRTATRPPGVTSSSSPPTSTTTTRGAPMPGPAAGSLLGANIAGSRSRPSDRSTSELGSKTCRRNMAAQGSSSSSRPCACCSIGW